MSPASRMKRALVSLLLHLARIYSVTVAVSRDSPDPEVRSAYRRVCLKVHPDKAGGCKDATVNLNVAYSSWVDAMRTPGKAGRPSKPQARTATHSSLSSSGPDAKRRKEYRIQGKACSTWQDGVPPASTQCFAFSCGAEAGSSVRKGSAQSLRGGLVQEGCCLAGLV